MGKITEIVAQRASQKYATEQGTIKHEKMRRVLIDGDKTCGDAEMVQAVMSRPNLIPYFGPDSRTEVPLAGRINGKFISRRIDRLIINHETHSVVFLDYKSDTDKTAYRDKYVHQMREYAQLLTDIFPTYSISGLILWLNDFTIEKIY